MELLFKYVNQKNNELKSSNGTFKDIFSVIHNQGKRIFAEYIKDFSIKTFSYVQIKEYCFKTATFLKNNIHLPKDTFVGLYMENSIHWVATF